MNKKNKIAIATSTRIVQEQGTIYLIPLGRSPIRLNNTASDIIQLLLKDETVDEVIAKYAIEYKCPQTEAFEDVKKFIDWLKSENLLEEDAELRTGG